jgi:methionyl-tRNA synthetase
MLRYYLAKLNAKERDIDFNADDFLARVNSDLVGKYINIASRAMASCSGLASKLGEVRPTVRRCSRACAGSTPSPALRNPRMPRPCAKPWH